VDANWVKEIYISGDYSYIEMFATEVVNGKVQRAIDAENSKAKTYLINLERDLT
jgi:hypothetical protein